MAVVETSCIETVAIVTMVAPLALHDCTQADSSAKCERPGHRGDGTEIHTDSDASFRVEAFQPLTTSVSANAKASAVAVDLHPGSLSFASRSSKVVVVADQIEIRVEA